MPRTRPSSALGRLVKQLIGCLLLGAFAQYVVAAGFGLVGTYPYSNGTGWNLQGSQGRWSARLQLARYPSPGREVLFGAYSAAPVGPRTLAAPPPIDWNTVVWEDEFELVDGAGEPPAWSRFTRLAANRDPNCYPTIYLWDWFVEVGCGWPMTSASYVARWRNVSGGFDVHDGAVLANTQPGPWITPRVIPLRIHWHGAISNTLLYAAALSMLVVCFRLLRATRRHLRRRAGHCPNCNYDLRASTTGTCPECGAAILPRVTP